MSKSINQSKLKGQKQLTNQIKGQIKLPIKLKGQNH